MPDHQHVPDWVVRGKTIRQLISELKAFENQDLEVRISTDNGNSFRPISLVTRELTDDEAVRFCGLKNCEDTKE